MIYNALSSTLYFQTNPSLGRLSGPFSFAWKLAYQPLLQVRLRFPGFQYGFVWSTPFYPMVLLIIIPMKNGYFIGGIPHFQVQTHIVDVHPSRNRMKQLGVHGWIHVTDHFLEHFWDG